MSLRSYNFFLTLCLMAGSINLSAMTEPGAPEQAPAEPATTSQLATPVIPLPESSTPIAQPGDMPAPEATDRTAPVIPTPEETVQPVMQDTQAVPTVTEESLAATTEPILPTVTAPSTVMAENAIPEQAPVEQSSVSTEQPSVVPATESDTATALSTLKTETESAPQLDLKDNEIPDQAVLVRPSQQLPQPEPEATQQPIDEQALQQPIEQVPDSATQFDGNQSGIPVDTSKEDAEIAALMNELNANNELLNQGEPTPQ